MTPIVKKGARFGLALLGAASLFAPAAAAVQPAYGTVTETPGDALSRNLKLIAESPHNVGALVGAGKAALDLGDPQAALTFFARAEQDAPRDGWVKKWMGSALVQLEQPAAALKFFRDAVSFGLPDASVAGDRGLAWDISGDPRRAQRDYRLALSRGSDPEITRRLALSLAISGEREPALQLIQDQVMQRDRAALRTRALVLALTGDRQGADRAVEIAMPGAQAAALEPFLARLPTLSLADRALAVHLGHFPGTGRAALPPGQGYAQNAYGGGLPAGYTQTPSYPASASSAPRRNSSSLLDAGRPDESRPGFGRPVAMAEPAAPRRIPGAQSEAPRPAAARNQIQSPPTEQWSWSRGEPSSRRPTQTASATPAPAARRPEPPPPRADVQEPDGDDARPDEAAATQQPESGAAQIPEAAPPVALRQVPRRAEAAAVPPPVQPATHSRLTEVAAELDRIEAERARLEAAGVPAAGTRMSGSRKRTATADATPSAGTGGVPPAGTRMSGSRNRTRIADATAAPKPAKKPPPPPREPARHWVQLGHGGSATLGGVFDRLKDKAPKLLAGRDPWVALGSPNRLVVGPFPSEQAAENFADRLGKSDLTALAWTSEAGQKVEKLSDQ